MPDFVHELRVRYGECDPQGIVFNAELPGVLRHTVTELWRASELGSWQAMVERGVDVVVGEANIRFRAPARFDDLIAIHARIAKFGTTSATLELEIRRDGELLIEGWLRQVFVDAKTWKKTEIPGWVREALGVYAQLRQRLRGAATKRSARSAAASRSRISTEAQPSSFGPPAASSSCQRATWRSISSWLTVRPRRRWPASALARSACRSRRCAGRPRSRASSAIVRRVSGQRAARVDHDGAAAGDRRRDPRVVAGVEERAAAGAVVGVDDPRDGAIDDAAQQRGLPRAGHAGDDDHRV